MTRTCPLCGKETEGAASLCPRCGEPLSALGHGEAPGPGGLVFPQRRTPSREDEHAAGRRKMFETGGRGSVEMAHESWEEIFQERPFDIPLFTVQGRRACIGVFLSRSFMSDARILDLILEQRRSFALQFATFPAQRHPVLRSNLLVPDDPRNPLILEAPLDILSGDIQDFCQAIVADERVVIVLAHEERGEASARGAVYKAGGLAPLLRHEVERAVHLLAPGASRADFDAAVREMEEAFPAAYHGLDQNRLVRLAFAEEI